MEYRPDVLKALQKAEFEILCAVDALCREEGIAYFLDGGTALGAVRHNGFIPWDDDIDIGMLRPDYDRFIERARIALPDAYELVVPGETPGYAAMFAKVMKRHTAFHTQETIEAGFDQGIFVDIFPYDGISPSARRARRQLSNGRLWQSISYLYHARSVNVPHRGLLGRAERFACTAAHGLLRAVTDERRIARSFARSIQRDGDYDRFTALAWPVAGGFPKADLVPAGTASFEGRPFPVPANVEAYLTRMYGPSWIELPPPDQRKNHAPVVLEL